MFAVSYEGIYRFAMGKEALLSILMTFVCALLFMGALVCYGFLAFRKPKEGAL